MRQFFLVIVSLVAVVANAQHSFKAIVKNKATQQPLANASITTGTQGGSTNANGQLTINNLPAGKQSFTVTLVGYASQTIEATLPDTSTHIILLAEETKALEEVTVVSSTRNNQRIENAPMKVEVLGSEEMGEENTIKPANIASILGDVSGVQIQQSSAVSGNANVRIQGLDGRYTQILRDGMPLFDGFSGGFGILTIPPLDLKQIELIKGSASTLYGGGAIGGLINLISKKPTYQQEGLLTLNQTTLKESNINTYLSKRGKTVGYNFFGGFTHQQQVDVNKDGFSDVAKTNAFIVHPKLFLYPSSNSTITIGYTGTFETRKGGDMQVLQSKPDALHQFFEENITARNTVDVLYDQTLAHNNKLQIKASTSSFDRTINTNTYSFKGNQFNYFSEASLLLPRGANSWVFGINATGDKFQKKSNSNIALQNFDNNTVGAFAQYSGKLPFGTNLEVGLRADHHAQYGDFVLPRIAALHRFNEHWAMRAGVGLGYKTPNVLSQQNVEYSIQDIQPLSNNVTAEKSVGYNLEVNYKKQFDEHSSLFINHAFFYTQISNPVIATLQTSGAVTFNNATNTITSKGFDTYVQVKLEGWELYAGYTFTIARRNYLSSNKFMPLTPKNRFAFVVVHELEEAGWRFGVEGSYTGPQNRDGDIKTQGYFFMAALVDKKISSKINLVLNCENLLDFRQSNKEALYTGTITNPSFKPLWAPIDGRVVNLSLRWKFAGK
jgi:iron complex outermembrane receptor protein/outer membrane receptor for ferrienterochelin and colicins